jgi:5-methylcytosine-specific restriction endonuclease McrA
MAPEFKTVSTREKKPVKGKGEPGSNAGDFVRKIKQEQKDSKTEFDYRELSLKIHGVVCGRCGREFSGKNLRMLTVHHKDGDHFNNPRNGSNWENLCIDCHEAAHSQDRLADFVGSGNRNSRKHTENSGKIISAEEEPKLTLADQLKAAMEKKNK